MNPEDLRVGDKVLVPARVQELGADGPLVQLLLPAGHGWAGIRVTDPGVLVAVHEPEPPAEPPVDSYLVNLGGRIGGLEVIHRDDANAPHEPDRRHPRRWRLAGRDVTGADSNWLDWPTAWRDWGFDPSQRINGVLDAIYEGTKS